MTARASFREALSGSSERDQALARLTADVEGKGVAKADVVIEAIFENLEAKRALYARLEPQMKPNAVLATNTSSIVLEQLAEKLAAPSAPDRPAFLQPCRRACRSSRSYESTFSDAKMVQRGTRLLATDRQVALACHSSPGFLVNRVLMPYLSEAVRAAEEGVPFAADRSCSRRLRHANGSDRAGRCRRSRRRDECRQGLLPILGRRGSGSNPAAI